MSLTPGKREGDSSKAQVYCRHKSAINQEVARRIRKKEEGERSDRATGGAVTQYRMPPIYPSLSKGSGSLCCVCASGQERECATMEMGPPRFVPLSPSSPLSFSHGDQYLPRAVSSSSGLPNGLAFVSLGCTLFGERRKRKRDIPQRRVHTRLACLKSHEGGGEGLG